MTIINRGAYIEALQKQLEPNIVKHSFALEACMGGLYDYFFSLGQIGPDEPSRDDWTLSGLIHDIDFGGEFKEFHPGKTKEALAKYGLTINEIVYKLIQSHDGRQGINKTTKAQWSIFCADSLTGLIAAVALVLPSKKLCDVQLPSVVKRFLKQPRFAAGTRREEVAMCSKPEALNLPLEKFIEICLTSMQKISSEIGL